MWLCLQICKSLYQLNAHLILNSLYLRLSLATSAKTLLLFKRADGGFECFIIERTKRKKNTNITNILVIGRFLQFFH